MELQQVNGHPGAVLRDQEGRVVNTLTLEIFEGQVQTIRAVMNPDKLGHVVPWRTRGRYYATRRRLAECRPTRECADRAEMPRLHPP